MNNKFQNKYRTESLRLQNWDYRWSSAYFLTICTQNKEHYFGKINNGKMQLSNIGILADVFWYEIKNHAKNVKLDSFVVMPNHIHGILILNDNNVNDIDGNINGCDGGRDKACLVSTMTIPLQSSQQKQNIGQKRFQNQGKNSVSSIIGSYKSAVTKHANRLGFDFKWQSGFYDHIIRNDKSYKKISNYIINNQKNWKDDKFHN